MNNKYLMIALHGYGANGANLMPAISHLAKELKIGGLDFLVPNAPEPYDYGMSNSYQWFSLLEQMRYDRSKLEAGVGAANQWLDEYIAHELSIRDIAPKNLVLVGFSQGAMMAIHHGLWRSTAPKAIIGYSGAISSSFLGVSKSSSILTVNSKAPICLVHGDADHVVPHAMMNDAAAILGSHNIIPETHLLKNLDHSISLAGIKLGADFISRQI